MELKTILKLNPNIKEEDYAYHENCMEYFLYKLEKYNGNYDYITKNDEKYKLGLKCFQYLSDKGSVVIKW